jgi:catechol 2,3-dioxygenase-like lactoylglutathione lyase family enzyme
MTAVVPVSLTVADLPRALAFYTERLGFSVHAGGSLIRDPSGNAVRLAARKGWLNYGSGLAIIVWVAS